MKNFKTILFFASVLAILNVNAQEKKQAVTKKTSSIVTKTPTKSSTAKASSHSNGAKQEPLKTSSSNPIVQERTEDNVKSSEAEAVRQAPTVEQVEQLAKLDSARPFKGALGIKFLWGISATGKYFFKDHQAIEAIIRYRSFGGIVNDFTVTAIYQYEKPIAEVNGLYWIIGGGLYFGSSSIKNSILPIEYREGSGRSYFGIAGMAGLEYKFERLPIAISADWMPAINFNGGGFGAENGGIGVKYTF